jgi:hypothetical protein
MDKINVCCLKEGTKYDSDYVNTLYLMVKRYLTTPFNFLCLTEDPKNLLKEIQVINLDDRSIKGWWNKCLLFKPGLLNGKCLYLDLDMIILKNIDEFLVENQYLNILCNPILLSEKIYYNINSSMLFWNTNIKDLNKIYFQYLNNKIFYDTHKPSMNEVIGDQRVILDSKIKYKFFPTDKIRYLKFLKEKDALNHNISIIVCKGLKNKDYKSNFFIKNYWK